MNRNSKISLSLLLIPTITFCSQRDAEGKASNQRLPGAGITIVPGGKPRASGPDLDIANLATDGIVAVGAKVSGTQQEEADVKNKGAAVASAGAAGATAPAKPASPALPIAPATIMTSAAIARATLGTVYPVPVIPQQTKTYFPGILTGYDGKGIRESARQFVERLTRTQKLGDAFTKPDNLEYKEPKAGERVTEALREINKTFNQRQKSAHEALTTLLNSQRTALTEESNAMLEILLALEGMPTASRTISAQDIGTYSSNLEREIEAIKEGAKAFTKEKTEQIKHLRLIQQKLEEHLTGKKASTKQEDPK